MRVTPYVLCPIVATSEWAEKLNLPALEQNIFFRIIKNPHSESDCPKELPCTEMLAGVLMNSRLLRHALLRWMGRKLGISSTPWADEMATTYIRTEQTVEGKRDDLRVEVESKQGLSVLWSVEVKVGANLHTSSSIDTEMEVDEHVVDEGAQEEVSQLINYDHQLLLPAIRKNPKASVAGFLLAKRNLQNELNKLGDELQCPWRCITWTELGMEIARVLSEDDLPEADAFLARHILGFINTYMWEEEKMTNTIVDVDDISLIKAYGVLGSECERKIDNLVSPLGEVLTGAMQGIGKPMHQKSLFKGNKRSVVYAGIAAGKQHPTLFAGVVLGDRDNPSPTVSVWIETPPGNPIKSLVREKLKQAITELQKNGWILCDAAGFWDIEKSASMRQFLGAEDQPAWIRGFTEKAIEELKAVGLIDALRSIAK